MKRAHRVINGQGKAASPENFIRLWQAASTAKEVAAKLGLSARTVSVRASRYRRRGIELKRLYAYGRGNALPLDVTALAKLAKKLAP